MSLLRVSNLSLAIHGAPILKDVSFEIVPGEIFALVGESGSGKSMTALSAMQLLPQGTTTTGAITLTGTPLLNAPEPQMCALRGREIGMIFQEPMTALNPVQTIGDQVAETLRVHGVTDRTEALEIARERLNRVGLDADRFPLDRYPHELSGGQRQRVCIAMAIALRPKLLIADEPTTALDVSTQAQILALLKELVADEGMGLMLITHDLAVVSRMADRVAVMKDGEIVEDGATEALFRTRAHPYTQKLFSASTHRPTRAHPRSGATVLDVAQVSRDYGRAGLSLFGPRTKTRAVDSATLTIGEGESVGLVGESGCGKSTLSRTILGLDPIAEGTVTLTDHPIQAGRVPNALRREMQVVFQDPYGSFNPRHRVERLVAEPFHLADQPPADIRAAVAEALEAVGLGPEAMDRYIHEFSGGQRQRIAIARALIIRPKLIILDEAVSALDVSIRAQVLDLLADLQGRFGLSYLFVSHDLHVVRAITDRVYVMRAGRIVEDGETEQVFSQPKADYTKSLIDATPTIPDNWR
ncbi:MAG: ABC transporter ATP-binding protein [Rhodobacteraceae bacterium]|nr:ABC transporter ATP-binding protein [Paracoccaceae bacterium]